MGGVVSFDEAMQTIAGASNRHLLLGNGFSIALKPASLHTGRYTKMQTLQKRLKYRGFSMHSKPVILIWSSEV